MAEAKAIKARYVGDPRNPGEPVPDVMDHLGLTFESGKYTEVPAELAEKFAGNDHFEVQGAKKTQPEETGETTREFADRVSQITDREGLEAMLADEKRQAAKGVLQARLDALPVAPAA